MYSWVDLCNHPFIQARDAVLASMVKPEPMEDSLPATQPAQIKPEDVVSEVPATVPPVANPGDNPFACGGDKAEEEELAYPPYTQPAHPMETDVGEGPKETQPEDMPNERLPSPEHHPNMPEEVMHSPVPPDNQQGLEDSPPGCETRAPNKCDHEGDGEKTPEVLPSELAKQFEVEVTAVFGDDDDDEPMNDAENNVYEPRSPSPMREDGQHVPPVITTPPCPHVASQPPPPPMPPQQALAKVPPALPPVPPVPVSVGLGGVKRPPDSQEAYYFTESVPPPVLSKSAIYNRLWRVFQRRKDGSRLVDQRWCDMWADIGQGRNDVESMFEKVGYNVDRVCQRNKIAVFFILVTTFGHNVKS